MPVREIDRIRAGVFRGNPREFASEARDCSAQRAGGNNLENSSIHLCSGNSPATPPRIFDAFASGRDNIFYGLSHLLRAADPEKSGASAASLGTYPKFKRVHENQVSLSLSLSLSVYSPRVNSLLWRLNVTGAPGSD